MKRFVWRTSFELLKAPVLNLEIGTGGLDRNRFFYTTLYQHQPVRRIGRALA